jgi:hypothetical protein
MPNLPFASPEAPPQLQEAFGELVETVRPFAGRGQEATLAETFWGALHGVLTLMRNGRLRQEEHERRMAILVSRFTG